MSKKNSGSLGLTYVVFRKGSERAESFAKLLGNREVQSIPFLYEHDKSKHFGVVNRLYNDNGSIKANITVYHDDVLTDEMKSVKNQIKEGNIPGGSIRLRASGSAGKNFDLKQNPFDINESDLEMLEMSCTQAPKYEETQVEKIESAQIMVDVKASSDGNNISEITMPVKFQLDQGN